MMGFDILLGDEGTIDAGGNVTLASGPQDGNDILLGTKTPTAVRSGRERFLEGAAGRDLLVGGAWSGFLAGGDEVNPTLTVFQPELGDTIIGEAGPDQIDGGLGLDLVSYTGSPAAVVVDLATGVGRGSDAEGDTFMRVEDVDGSAFNDVLKAVVVASQPGQRGSVLRGLAGDDKLVAGPLFMEIQGGLRIGDDLRGGDGIDTLSYEDSTDGVVVNLSQNIYDVVAPRTPHDKVGNFSTTA